MEYRTLIESKKRQTNIFKKNIQSILSIGDVTMINWLELITAIVSLLVPILDFVFSKVTKKNYEKSDVYYRSSLKSAQISGDGNISIQGNGNTLVDKSRITKIKNIYPQVSKGGKSNGSSDIVVMLFVGIVTIICFATYKAELVNIVVLVNLLLILTVKLSNKYIIPKSKMFLYTTSILASAVVLLLIQRGLFAPAGYTQYLAAFTLQSVMMHGWNSITTLTKGGYYWYLLLEMFTIIVYVELAILEIWELLRPAIYNISKNRFGFISDKLRIKKQAEFNKSVTRYNTVAFIVTVLAVIGLKWEPQIIAWISKEYSALLSYIISIPK